MPAQKKTHSYKRLLILDSQTAFIGEGNEKDCLLIDRAETFKQFINKPFKMGEVLVLVELEWESRVSAFKGYQVAASLLDSPNRQGKFNLAFLSTIPRELLYEKNNGKNKVFTQKFPHFQLNSDFDLAQLKVPHFSEQKLNYLKNYCLIETGIIDRLEHDLRNAVSSKSPDKVKRVLDSLYANRSLLPNNIIHLVEVAHKQSFTQSVKLLEEIHHELIEWKKQLSDNNAQQRKKSHSRVMVVEDDEKTMQTLQKLLKSYFQYVKFFKSGSRAYDELVHNAHNYDVVISDMELLDGQFDDLKQGVDILELCEKKYPFLVTRILTALPKNAIKILLNRSVDHIIYKDGNSQSAISVFEDLTEFVNQIDLEVNKRNLLRSMQGPNGSWWGKYLTRQLYVTKVDEPDVYNKIWEEAKKQAYRLLSGKYDNDSLDKKLSTTFKSTETISKRPEEGWSIIELLLAHRLIAIAFAQKYEWQLFYYKGESEDAYCRQRGFLPELTKSAKAYFNTVLGLSYTYSKQNSQKIAVQEDKLFPEEKEWLNQYKKELAMLSREYPDLFLLIAKIDNVADQSELTPEMSVCKGINILEAFFNEYRFYTKPSELRQLTQSIVNYCATASELILLPSKAQKILLELRELPSTITLS